GDGPGESWPDCLGLLLGPRAPRLYRCGQELSGVEALGPALAAPDPPGLPAQRPATGATRHTGLCRGGCRLATGDGRHESPGGRGVVQPPSAPTVPKSAGEPARALDGVDALRGRPANPDGQQRFGAVPAR